MHIFTAPAWRESLRKKHQRVHLGSWWVWGSASVWKPLCYTILSTLRANRSDTQVAECLSENSEPLEKDLWIASAQTQCETSKWTRNKQQRQEILCLNPSTNMGCGNESLWKSAPSQKSAERHLVLITLLADSRMSPVLFLSLLHHSSSICRFSSPSAFLGISPSLSLLSFSLTFCLSFLWLMSRSSANLLALVCSSAVQEAVV